MNDNPPVDRSSGLEPTPGLYEYRYRKTAPIQPVRITYDGEFWHVFVVGKLAVGSGKLDPMEIPLLLNRWPLRPITEERFEFLLGQFAAAQKTYAETRKPSF